MRDIYLLMASTVPQVKGPFANMGGLSSLYTLMGSILWTTTKLSCSPERNVPLQMIKCQFDVIFPKLIFNGK